MNSDRKLPQCRKPKEWTRANWVVDKISKIGPAVQHPSWKISVLGLLLLLRRKFHVGESDGNGSAARANPIPGTPAPLIQGLGRASNRPSRKTSIAETAIGSPLWIDTVP